MDQLIAAYLDNSRGQWSDCLLSSYAYLRHSWKSKWIGLPTLLKSCATFLNLLPGDVIDTSNLLNAAIAIALQIEDEKGCGIDTEEPSYHNRLHFADSLTTITLQCGLEIRNGAQNDKAWLAAMLLIALCHDFRHPGRVNQHTSEIESNTVNFLRPILISKEVSPLWIDRLSEIILRSDFSLVKQNHSRVKDRSFQWETEWATVLLNEADIMASASRTFGLMNSQALSMEWQAVNFPAYSTVATPEGRRQFLSSIQFTSYSARVLSSNILESI